jgi:hypothetical protein
VSKGIHRLRNGLSEGTCCMCKLLTEKRPAVRSIEIRGHSSLSSPQAGVSSITCSPYQTAIDYQISDSRCPLFGIGGVGNEQTLLDKPT